MKYILCIFLVLTGVCSFAQDKGLLCISAASYAYHKGYCQGLNQCTHQVKEYTLQEALDRKRKPCGYCYKQGSSTTPVEPSGAGQCQATTKKGTQCSRNSRSRGYCWQHGG